MDELKIIQYLEGEMSGRELEKFKEEIRSNPLLAEEIEKYRKLEELARESLSGEEPGGSVAPDEIKREVEDFKKDPASAREGLPPGFMENLQDAGERYSGTGPPRTASPQIRRIWFRAAAIAVLAVIASILVFRPFSLRPPGDIYAEYYTPFLKTGDILEMARADNDFMFATEVYEAGDYEWAVILFTMLADSSAIGDWSLFYAGCAYMSLNQTGEAVSRFKEVLLSEDLELVSAAKWQLALCHLKRGETEPAIGYLENLLDDPAYRKDARKILRVFK
jgi:tetratricopeptide (TPR) repeat protein